MKTPRIFIALISPALLTAMVVACLSLTPATSFALDHPAAIEKELGPYLGDPDQPSAPYENFSYQEDNQTAQGGESIQTGRRGFHTWSKSVWYLRLLTALLGR